jgi:hypothetical protein
MWAGRERPVTRLRTINADVWPCPPTTAYIGETEMVSVETGQTGETGEAEC